MALLICIHSNLQYLLFQTVLSDLHVHGSKAELSEKEKQTF